MASEMGMEGYGPERLLEPEVNIALGCYYLNWLYRRYDGDLTLVLCAYNAGLGNVNRWLADARYSEDGVTLALIPFEETRAHVRRVEENQWVYKHLRGIP
jgi:soluble lytic murein transglycosylase